MKDCISIHLRFSQYSKNGRVSGNARAAAFVHGELPGIGERLVLGSSSSEINIISDRYELRITDLCRTVGGKYITTYFCDVSFARRDFNSGKDVDTNLTKEQVAEDWKLLQRLFERTWSHEREEGVCITDLNLA